MTMYGNIWPNMTMYDYVCACMSMYAFEWLYMTMYDFVWLCMTMFEREIERESNFKSFFKLFQTIKKFQTIQTFYHDSNVLKLSLLFNKPWLCLPLFTFVYLCLPLFTFDQMTHLCTNFVLVSTTTPLEGCTLLTSSPKGEGGITKWLNCQAQFQL